MCKAWPVLPEKEKGKRVLYLYDCPLTKHLSEKEIEKCKVEALKIEDDILEGQLSQSKLAKEDIERIKKGLSKFEKKKIN